MKTAGIILDEWKIAVFERHLCENGFTPSSQLSPMPGQAVKLLKVSYNDQNVAKLHYTLQKATEECRHISASVAKVTTGVKNGKY
jgi:hypothetical protein